MTGFSYRDNISFKKLSAASNGPGQDAMATFALEETYSREQMEALQLQRLKKQAAYVYENVAPYRKKMDEAGVTPADVRSLKDLALLPFTSKQDLRDSYPFGMFAVGRDKLARVHASSGTTGRQTVVGYTKEDLEMWGRITARALVASGATGSDLIHISYGYGLFTGGFGIHGAAEALGACVIPVSTGNTRRQIDVLQDFGSDILCCTPSYALYMGESLQQMGIDPRSLRLRAGIFGAEPWTEGMREAIERLLDLKAFDIYGLSEVMGPGVAYECAERGGLHINEDHFLPEIVDPVTGEALPEGVEGELVFTCLTKQALPLIRYRTHDLARLSYGKCACGRTLVKMSRPKGRTDDMLIIRGVNVFPSQVETVLMQFPWLSANYQLIVTREGALDQLEVQAEMDESAVFDTVKAVEQKQREIRSRIESMLGIAASVRLLPPRSLARSEGKAKRVIDKRSL